MFPDVRQWMLLRSHCLLRLSALLILWVVHGKSHVVQVQLLDQCFLIRNRSQMLTHVQTTTSIQRVVKHVEQAVQLFRKLRAEAVEAGGVEGRKHRRNVDLKVGCFFEQNCETGSISIRIPAIRMRYLQPFSRAPKLLFCNFSGGSI